MAGEQVSGLGVEAREHQGHGATVLVARRKDRVAELQDLGPQVRNRDPRCQILYRFGTLEVIILVTSSCGLSVCELKCR